MKQRSSQRISLSLSQEAYSILKSDMDVFQNEQNLDGFINRIISNFREHSDASISLAKDRVRDKYTNWIKRDSGHDTLTPEDNSCINRLVNCYAEDLKKKMNSFENGIPIKPRINNENFDVLCMGTLDFQEDEYYPREGRYIKALIEEYAILSFYEREEVFFKDIINSINESIATNNVIKINYTNRKQMRTAITVRPYKIVSSPLLRYHYLLALSSERDNKDIFTLRISRIESVRKLSRTSHITQSEKEYVDTEIRNKGIQYLVSKNSEIKVLLTPQGYKLYKSILYLRPKAVSITPIKDKWELQFICAEEQIKNYFFQFGKEAMILSPLPLREWFEVRYREAAETYIQESNYIG